MKTQLRILAAACVASWPALAGAWTLEPETSNVAFGSIKNDYVGEAHTFSKISGGVNDNGQVSIDVDLASVSTNIDIRNERLIEHVFGGLAKANITAGVDMEMLEAIEVGDSMTFEVEATLSFLGTEVPFYLDMFVMRLTEDRVLASSNTPVYIPTEDLTIEKGIDVLQELASLDSITRVTPLTARFVFTR